MNKVTFFAMLLSFTKLFHKKYTPAAYCLQQYFFLMILHNSKLANENRTKDTFKTSFSYSRDMTYGMSLSVLLIHSDNSVHLLQ